MDSPTPVLVEIMATKHISRGDTLRWDGHVVPRPIPHHHIAVDSYFGTHRLTDDWTPNRRRQVRDCTPPESCVNSDQALWDVWEADRSSAAPVFPLILVGNSCLPIPGQDRTYNGAW